MVKNMGLDQNLEKKIYTNFLYYFGFYFVGCLMIHLKFIFLAKVQNSKQKKYPFLFFSLHIISEIK